MEQILDKYAYLGNPYRQVLVESEELDECWKLTSDQAELLQCYLEANLLLVRCLEVAYVPNRKAIENQILLPPA